MATMSMNIDVQGADVSAALRALGVTVSPAGLATFLNTRGKEWMQQRAADRFDVEGDDASGEWADLKETTYEIREATGYVPVTINKRTGALHNWVTNAPGLTVATPELSMLTWPGTPPTPDMMTKMMTAQGGKPERPRTVARPVVAVNEADLAAVLGLLGNFIFQSEVMAAFR